MESEHLATDHGIAVTPETLRRWLISSGLWESRRRRQSHRAARERRPRRGDLVQIDGSEHDWFEGRGPRAVMMVMIDDATNRTLARFYTAEDTAAAYDIVRGPETQFARAMRELGVDLIPAYSPQVKGRVERRHGLFQDRLVKEMRLRLRLLRRVPLRRPPQPRARLRPHFCAPSSSSRNRPSMATIRPHQPPGLPPHIKRNQQHEKGTFLLCVDSLFVSVDKSFGNSYCPPDN